MSRHDHKDPTDRSLLLGVGAAAFMVVCCLLLPILITGGTLAAAGGALRSPWLLGTGAVLLLLGVFAFAGRHDRGGGDDCCSPGNKPPNEDSFRPEGRQD